MTIAPLEVIERLFTEERLRFPVLESGPGIPDSPEVLIARERREWELADLILRGSEYVADSLAEVGVPASKCRVVRWGYSGSRVETDRSQYTGPLRVLIAGTVELRKGIPDALEAARLLADTRYHLRFVGPLRVSGRVIEEQFTHRISGTTIEYGGPVPRSQMSLEYQSADMLLHPSLAEGSAIVCYEAMAHGLPVIATPDAGAIITDGQVCPSYERTNIHETSPPISTDRPGSRRRCSDTAAAPGRVTRSECGLADLSRDKAGVD